MVTSDDDMEYTLARVEIKVNGKKYMVKMGAREKKGVGLFLVMTLLKQS